MNVLLTGGGTGGHVTPLIAIASELRKKYPRIRIGFVGRQGGAENEAIKRTGIPIFSLNITGLERKINQNSFKSIKNAFEAQRKARNILKQFEAGLVIGTGGYVCWPTLSAAKALSIPTVLHESNSVAGMAVKILASKADLLLIGQKRVEGLNGGFFVGNPISSEFGSYTKGFARASLGIPKNCRLILSAGGSGGANTFNTTVPEAVKNILDKNDRIYYVYASGQKYYENAMERFSDATSARFKIFPYINDMPRMLAAADLAIVRAGAMTLAELAASKCPAIIIPSPNVTRDHQRKNATVFEKANAATVIDETNLDAGKLADAILEILSNDEHRTAMADHMGMLAVHDSAERAVKLIAERFFVTN